ncbi:MAG TPA: sugar kinase [Trueperaceae bacterium]
MPEVAGREPRFDVTSIGESMLRLSVGIGHRIASAGSFDAHVAGAESNVCAALAGLGRKTGWVSRLPKNPLGELVLARARSWGIDTEQVVMAPNGRLGTYFVELAAPPMPARVTYDRAGSAFSELTPDEVDWEYLLDTRLLHLTGITPALGGALPSLITDAVARAKERGILVSLDVNYRAQLWAEEEAARYLRPLLEEIDLLFCSSNDAIRVFGLEAGDSAQLLTGLRAMTSARHVVVTQDSEGAIAWSDGRLLHQPALPVTIVDRIGAGDALSAGVIDGVLAGDAQGGLANGVALAAVALSQHGDVVSVGRDELAIVTAFANIRGTSVLR